MYGYNVHADFLRNKQHLREHRKRVRSECTLVMDGENLARDMLADLPGKLVVHRAYNRHDFEWHKHISAKDFVARYGRYGSAGLICYVGNEPDLSGNMRPYAEYLASIAAIMNQEDVTGCFLNAGVGNPHETRLAELDPLWAALKGTRHYLGLHEYIPRRGVHGHGVVPWLVGRFRMIIGYVAAKHGYQPNIILTECGGDAIGEAGYKRHWSETQYLSELDAAMLEHWSHSAIRGRTCLFCYGNSAGRWNDWNLEDALTFQEGLERRAAERPAPPAPPLPPPIDALPAIAYDLDRTNVRLQEYVHERE